jgi:VanZ family protein
MNSLIVKLHERKPLAFLLAALYFAAVSLPHKEVSKIFDWLSRELSFGVYNDALFKVNVFLAIVSSAFMLLRIRNGNRRALKITYWLFTAFLVGASYEILIVFNVESIHFPQYAVLALLVFPLVMRYGDTVFWCTLLGALDEGYQYFVLYRDNNEVYFDFNDILLNLVGAGIGVLILFTLADDRSKRSTAHTHSSLNRSRSPVIVTTAFLFAAGFFFSMTGHLQLYPEAGASGTPFILMSRKPAATSFWTEPKRGKAFHILTPLEGIISAAALIGCYASMDRCFAKRPSRETDG